MAHSIKNPQTIHLRINTSDIRMRPIEVITRYLCCGSFTLSKSTRHISEVTCKNCIREIKRSICPNCGNPRWPVAEEPQVTCPPPAAPTLVPSVDCPQCASFYQCALDEKPSCFKPIKPPAAPVTAARGSSLACDEQAPEQQRDTRPVTPSLRDDERV